MNKKKILRCSLSLLIAAIISMLLIALGVAITYYTYENQKKTALESTEKIFDVSSMHIEEKLFSLIHSVESIVAISSGLESLGVWGEETMSLLLPYFQQSFTNIPWMESFYVGHDDGSFFMIQTIRENEKISRAIAAPVQAAYAVKSIAPVVDGERQMLFHYYDADLTLLETRKADYDGYDPRKRKWYGDARSTQGIVVTSPYLFFTTGEIGITVSHALTNGTGVVGADSVLTALAQLLQEQKLTPSTQIVLMDIAGNVIFSAEEGDLIRIEAKRKTDAEGTLHVKELEQQAANIMFLKNGAKDVAGVEVLEVDGRKWFGHSRKLVTRNKDGIYLVISSPFDELMQNARAIRKRNTLIVFSVLLVAVILGIYLSRRIAGSLQELSAQAENVRDFKLTSPFAVQSRICEVDQLADSMTVMQSAINRFVEIARALSAEKQMDKVLEMIVTEAQSVTGSDGGGIGLVSDDGKSFSYVLARNMKTDVHLGGCSDCEIPDASLSLEKDGGEGDPLEVTVVKMGVTKAIADVSLSVTDACSNIRKLHEKDDYQCHSLLVIPLLNRQDEVIGLLHLVNARDQDNGNIVPFSEHRITYVEALSSNAALALDNNRLIRAQKELFDSFVRLIAGAIDTKSPYTGGHCQRVPVIADMLADAASSATTPAFAEFQLSEDERYELFVASWLHDCGKVTTPEYVVDKATKLETIYNRVHEVRTRFEVLWRDADIVFYKGLIKDSKNESRLQVERDLQRLKLQDDFAYLAECNVGGEFMAPERVERLQEIGGQEWDRNFDNRLGLSGDEEVRLNMDAEVSFPVTETLLADRAEHIIPRLDGGNPYGDNPWHIVMPVPEYSYNLGELYNLSIAKGTLTDEERYKINDHIVQTIDMLNKLPFPKEIRRVPDWAGNHHEKLDGSGYPRCLTGEQLSIPERIMAVADIFEALTAADRPYKKAKSLNTCIKIMSFMRNDGHICPDLFELFLQSGIYKEYAEKHMQAEQIDEVDIATYLKKGINT
jgi:HD-GYP domain-containing protein (c-di-GMP phosphodiesterase class II)